MSAVYLTRSRLARLLWPRVGVAAILLAAVAIAFGSPRAGQAADPAGVITEYPLPTAGSSPWGIAAGPDSNLWVTERAANGVAMVARVTTSGVFTEYPVPTVNSGPFRIVAGPDGNLWFTEQNVAKVARVTTGGVFTEYPIPTVGNHSSAIAAGPDGNLWITEESDSGMVAGKVARVTTSGVFTEYPIPTGYLQALA